MMTKEDRIWDEFKQAVLSKNWKEASKLYSEYLKVIPPYNRTLFIGRFTYDGIPGTPKFWPRSAVPFLFNFGWFRKHMFEYVKGVEEALDNESTILSEVEGTIEKAEQMLPELRRKFRGRKVPVHHTSCNWEPVTRCGFRWYENFVIPECDRLGLRVNRSSGPLAWKPPYDVCLLMSKFSFGVGHGGPRVFTGNFFDHLLEVGKYRPELVRGRIFKYLSCLTGKVLGPDVVRHGATAYFGYVKEYKFMWDPKYGLTKSEDDPIVRLFFWPVMKSTILLLNGFTCRFCYNLEREMYLWNARHMRGLDREIRETLVYEAHIFRLYGKKDATIYE